MPDARYAHTRSYLGTRYRIRPEGWSERQREICIARGCEGGTVGLRGSMVVDLLEEEARHLLDRGMSPASRGEAASWFGRGVGVWRSSIRRSPYEVLYPPAAAI